MSVSVLLQSWQDLHWDKFGSKIHRNRQLDCESHALLVRCGPPEWCSSDPE